MIDLIRDHQLNIMLLLCGSCGILIFLLFNTRFLSGSRKRILIFMESAALLLLWFDRLAYIYSGHKSLEAYIMVRVSNFFVFFLTSAIVFGFNMYISDWLKSGGGLTALPKRLFFTGAFSLLGMVLALISSFSGLYYYFDEANRYHRGQGFLIAYIIPVLCPLIQYTVIRQYRRIFSKLIYISMLLYIYIPIICGITQIFTYGISLVNISLAVVSLSMYVCMYMDLNNTVKHAYDIEIRNMQGEQERMERLFDQTATAFVSAVEKKDDFTKGNSLKIAEYAKKIALLAGKDEDAAEEVYYAALLHDVGMIGVPDKVIKNEADPDKWDYEAMRKKPIIGEEILSSITEYPYLSVGAHHSHERYNGTGYPDGLKGEEIPEIARIIAVADAFVTMTTKKRYRDARPRFMAREAFIRGAGEEFDPKFAEIMINIIDTETVNEDPENAQKPEKTISCRDYRENITLGIPVESEWRNISFDCEYPPDRDPEFSAPSIVLFDSFDRRTHSNKKSIDANHYLEYGEIWFDKYSITTAARKIVEKSLNDDIPQGGEEDEHYEILAGRFEDHLKLIMRSPSYTKEVSVSLPSVSKSAYIGLTGENCTLTDISVSLTGETVKEGDIERISDPLNYIDHLESDIANIQVDRTRSAHTKGIEIGRRLRIAFHSMSLPGADLVWHCPYVIIFYSEDGTVDGPGYRMYNMIKLNGEDEGETEYAHNSFSMKKLSDFPGWNEWKRLNREGLECVLYLERHGNEIRFKTENLGISIENKTMVSDAPPLVYVSLTGDQVALTDIRIE